MKDKRSDQEEKVTADSPLSACYLQTGLSNCLREEGSEDELDAHSNEVSDSRVCE